MRWVILSLLLATASVFFFGYHDIFDRGGYFPLYIYLLAYSGSLALTIAGILSPFRSLHILAYFFGLAGVFCNCAAIIAMRKYPEGATLEIVLRHEPSMNTKEELLGVYLGHQLKRIRLNRRTIKANTELELVQVSAEMGIRDGKYKLIFEPEDIFESQIVYLRKDNTLVDTVTLRKLDSRVTFMTEPTGATVKLDPLPKGINLNWRTTHTLQKFPRGIYEITFLKEEYDTVRVITAINSDHKIINITLRDVVTYAIAPDTQKLREPSILEQDSMILLLIEERELMNYIDLYLYADEVDSAMRLINSSLADPRITINTKSKLRNIKTMLQKRSN